MITLLLASGETLGQCVGLRQTCRREGMPTISNAKDKLAIRELIENWAVWRDSFQWDKFRTVWHPEGRMWATWFQGTYEEFIAANLDGYKRGVRIYHFLGGTSIEIKGKRAIAQTKMSISQRASVEGVECDVLCIGRFYDFLEKRKGQWGLVWRRLTYEKDSIIPIDPTKAPKLDPKLLASFPVGYKHLAYLQTKVGYKVKTDMPGVDGPATDVLYALGAGWLKGNKKIGW
jgi:hypothetical protein